VPSLRPRVTSAPFLHTIICPFILLRSDTTTPVLCLTFIAQFSILDHRYRLSCVLSLVTRLTYVALCPPRPIYPPLIVYYSLQSLPYALGSNRKHRLSESGSTSPESEAPRRKKPRTSGRSPPTIQYLWILLDEFTKSMTDPSLGTLHCCIPHRPLK